MPTPFTHLETAQRLLSDDEIAEDLRRELSAQAGAFLLGSVAADARTETGGDRAETHFYAYDKPMTERPWRVMLDRYPELRESSSAAHHAFLAGYVAHISMDEFWTINLVGPHIAFSTWGESRHFRFFVLHLILIYMDERDLLQLEPWQPETLHSAQPRNWLPFLSDEALCSWRDSIYNQIKPGGVSLTLDIFGSRIARAPEDLRSVLDSPELMKSYLWDNIPPSTLAQLENQMYSYARDQMQQYLRKFR